MSPERGQLSAGNFGDLLERALERRTVTHLIISDGLSERWLELGAGLLRLTAVGPRRGRGLIETLLEHPDVPAEVATRLQAAKSGPRDEEEDPVEQVLSMPGVRKIAQECRRVIVLDELIDTIVWEGAEFEVHEQVPPTAPPLDAGHEVIVLSSGAADLVKQVRALASEWAQLVKQLGVPSRTWVRRSGKPDDPSIETLETVLLSHLPPDGCLLDDVILGFRQSGPDALVACRTAVALASGRGLVTLDLAPPAPSGERRAAVARAELAQLEPVLPRLALPVHGQRRVARRQEEAGDVARAVDAWCTAGALLAADRRLDEAAAAYREAIRLSPRAAFARERLAAVVEELGPPEAAIAAWLEAAQGWVDLGLGHGALRTLRRAAQLAPARDDVAWRLIHTLAAMGRREEAAQAYEKMADRLESDGATADASACWQQLHRVAPDHPTARKSWRRAALRQGFVPVFAGVALVAIALGSGVVWLHGRRSDLDQTRALALDVEPLLRVGRFADARKNIAALEAKGSVAVPHLEHARALLDPVVADEGAATLARAASLEESGRLADALKEYHRLEVELAGTPHGDQAVARLAALAADEKSAQRDVDALTALRKDPSKQADAFARSRELVRRYGRTEAGRALTIPLEVVTTRAGAKVTVDGQSVGTTPCVVARPAAPFALEVTQDGFQPRRMSVDPLAADLAPKLKLDPQHRAVRWQVPTLGPLTAPPLAAAGGLVLAGSDQRVYGIAHDGVVRWTVRLSPFSVVLGAPIPIDDDVAVIVETLAGGGRALALDVRTGATRWSRDLAVPEPRALGALNGGALVSSATGSVLLLDGQSGAPRWTAELGSPPVLPPAVSGDRAVAVTEDGRVHLIDAQGRIELLQVAARLAASPVGTPRGWIVGAVTNEVSLLPAPNVNAWSRKLAQPLSAAPLTIDGLAIAPCGARLVALSLHDGAPRWERDLGSPAGQVGGRPGIIYVGAADGTVHALSTTSGQPVWTFRAEGAVSAAPLVSRGVVFVASEGGVLSAILETN